MTFDFESFLIFFNFESSTMYINELQYLSSLNNGVDVLIQSQVCFCRLTMETMIKGLREGCSSHISLSSLD